MTFSSLAVGSVNTTEIMEPINSSFAWKLQAKVIFNTAAFLNLLIYSFTPQNLSVVIQMATGIVNIKAVSL